VTDPVTIILMGRPVPAAQRNQFNAIPKRQKDQIALIRLEASRQMQDREMLQGPLSLTLMAEVPIPVSGTKKWKMGALAGLEWPLRRPDLKNLLWLVEDALTSVVYADDSLVCRHSTEKRYGQQPKIVVKVEEIPATPRRIEFPQKRPIL
jgi:Holliday junction resolvase RusA-like endonuclease